MLRVLILLLSLQSFLASAQQSPPKNIPEPKLVTPEDTMQYTLGAFMGLWLSGNGFEIKNQSMFLRGFEDILKNRTRIFPDSTIDKRVSAYQESAQQAKAMVLEKQLFATIKDKPGIGMFPNGVRYTILQAGKGAHAGENDSVVVNIIARLADGTKVEDTYQSGKPFVTRTNGFFTGLSEALQMMTVGSKWQVFIPSSLAYGAKGNGLIPPYSALIIDVELMEVRPLRK